MWLWAWKVLVPRINLKTHRRNRLAKKRTTIWKRLPELLSNGWDMCRIREDDTHCHPAVSYLYLVEIHCVLLVHHRENLRTSMVIRNHKPRRRSAHRGSSSDRSEARQVIEPQHPSEKTTIPEQKQSHSHNNNQKLSVSTSWWLHAMTSGTVSCTFKRKLGNQTQSTRSIDLDSVEIAANELQHFAWMAKKCDGSDK